MGGGNPPQIVETIIPLNRYGFFEELSDKILPPMQLEIEVTLQSDAESIWQNDGTDRQTSCCSYVWTHGPPCFDLLQRYNSLSTLFFWNQRAGDFWRRCWPHRHLEEMQMELGKFLQGSKTQNMSLRLSNRHEKSTLWPWLLTYLTLLT